MLGHASVAFTIETYTHPDEDELDRAAAAFEGALGSHRPPFAIRCRPAYSGRNANMTGANALVMEYAPRDSNPVRLMQRIGRVDRRLNPAIEEQLKSDHPEVAADRGKVAYWNFLPPDELHDLLRLSTRGVPGALRAPSRGLPIGEDGGAA